MKDRKIDERLKRIADHYGLNDQADKLVEEMAELMVAITHLKKRHENAADYMDNFVEELADVRIVVEQLIYLLGDDYRSDFDREIESKIKRTLARMQVEERHEVR